MTSPNHDAIVEATKLIMERISHAEDAMRYSMNQLLYADDKPAKPLTRWQRIKRRLALYRRRCGDAWLVLTGKAYIE